MTSNFSISSSVLLFSFTIVLFSAFILPIITENKFIRYALMILLIYLLNFLLIALNTAQHTCLPDKINYSYLFLQSSWPSILSVFVLGLINIDILYSFFIQPFKNIMDDNGSFGEALGEGINLMGISLSGQLITYYNVLNNSCIS